MDAVDLEIAAVRAQINALRQRRSLLSSALLSSNQAQALSKRLRTNGARSVAKHQADAIAAIQRSTVSVLASATRTTMGISAFRATEPDPHASHDGSIFGVRLDVYSAREHSFKPPYFLLFQQSRDDHVKLYQHTIPAFVPIPSLLKRYMSLDTARSNVQTGRTPRQNLAAFVRAVRRHLIAAQRREDGIARLAEDSSIKEGQFGIKRIANADPASTNIELHLRNGSLLKLQLGLDGSVARFSVGGQPSSDQDKKRSIERALTGFSGKVPELIHILQAI